MTSRRRLGAAAIGQLPPRVSRPAYLPQAATVGVVHLGVGNFFRAHQAAYLDEAMDAGASGWGICGVSLRNPATRDALQPQDGFYSLVERDTDGDRVRVVGALRELLVAREDPSKVVERMAAPTTRWITLTITEKGYGHVAGAGRATLDVAHPDIAHDLASQQAPRSAVGLLHAALRLRRRQQAPALTILSCDNLTSNGDLLRDLVLQYDRAVMAGESAWIEERLRFPNTMVDRIVPRTGPAQRELAAGLLEVDDAWPVVTERFRQWVIEDRFAGPRPPLEESGVQIVADVRPYEAMKLRLLNAAHSALAWLAVPAGIKTVDAAIAQPALRGFIDDLWRIEVIPGLDPALLGLAPQYCHDLVVRFGNPGLGHQTAQIAMDGSQKLPLRVLPSVRTNLALGLPIDRLALVVAAWIGYLEGVADDGSAYLPDEPMLDRLQPLARIRASRDAAAAVLREPSIFGDLAGNRPFAEAVATALESLRSLGRLRAAEAARDPGKG
jgi:fructuronate reductase